MKVTRRGFLGTAAAIGCGVMENSSQAQASTLSADTATTSAVFDGRLTPYLGQFWASANSDHGSQLRFLAEQGFRRFSDCSFFARPAHEQATIVKTKNELGLKLAAVELGADLSQATWAGIYGRPYQARVADAVKLLKQASQAGAETVVLQLGRDCSSRQLINSREQQEHFVVVQLRRMLDLCDDLNITLLLEPLQLLTGSAAQNGRRMFLETHRQTLRICQGVDHPRVRLLYDVYRQHQQGADLRRELEKALPVLGGVQLADGFRGQQSVRLEPGQGEVDFNNLLQVLNAGHFTGWLGMEHGVSALGIEGEQRVLSAYHLLSGQAPADRIVSSQYRRMA